ncbi:MAG TPA: hypothetical protein VFT39_04050 [Vicinamibacterales bacterium]|nr:hypothetical protein [Vicinamibacterales bacterium]
MVCIRRGTTTGLTAVALMASLTRTATASSGLPPADIRQSAERAVAAIQSSQAHQPAPAFRVARQHGDHVNESQAATALAAQSVDPLYGTWTLNHAKSKYTPGPPPPSQTRTFEPSGDGVRVTVQGTARDGSPMKYTFTAKFDGKDYPITGTAVSAGAEAIALRRIDARTIEWTYKRSGQSISRGETTRCTISPNGKTLSCSSSGILPSGQPFHSEPVFEKR